LEIVNHVAQSDTDLILQIQEQQNKLQARQAELEALESDLRSTQAELTKEENDLTASLTTEQGVLDQLNKDEADAAALVKQLKDKLAAEEEAARLAALEKAKEAKQGSISGVLLKCPVQGAVAYSDDFGAPRYGGGFHPHAGNDLFANRGTPIVAPFPGTATDASNGLGGLAVEVTGADGYVYNAHLD